MTQVYPLPLEPSAHDSTNCKQEPHDMTVCKPHRNSQTLILSLTLKVKSLHENMTKISDPIRAKFGLLEILSNELALLTLVCPEARDPCLNALQLALTACLQCKDQNRLRLDSARALDKAMQGTLHELQRGQSNQSQCDLRGIVRQKLSEESETVRESLKKLATKKTKGLSMLQCSPDLGISFLQSADIAESALLSQLQRLQIDLAFLESLLPICTPQSCTVATVEKKVKFSDHRSEVLIPMENRGCSALNIPTVIEALSLRASRDLKY